MVPKCADVICQAFMRRGPFFEVLGPCLTGVGRLPFPDFVASHKRRVHSQSTPGEDSLTGQFEGRFKQQDVVQVSTVRGRVDPKFVLH